MSSSLRVINSPFLEVLVVQESVRSTYCGLIPIEHGVVPRFPYVPGDGSDDGGLGFRRDIFMELRHVPKVHEGRQMRVSVPFDGLPQAPSHGTPQDDMVLIFMRTEKLGNDAKLGYRVPFFTKNGIHSTSSILNYMSF